MTEDEMVGWHHQLNGHEFEQALGDGKAREAWRAAVHAVAKNLTQLSGWTTIGLKWAEKVANDSPWVNWFQQNWNLLNTFQRL